ncbi:MAG: hypothetical protein ABSB60_15205 [Terracidiphilus sp.]|jgi:hypothetical protein
MRRAVLLAACFGVTAIAASAADSTKINGWISDSMCGAKHAGTGSACVKKCISDMGEAPVFVDEDKKEVWKIDNPDSVKAFYGDHVTIMATADTDKKSVHVDSISTAQ